MIIMMIIEGMWCSQTNNSGWWLGHPSEKYEFVNWDDNRNPIFLGKCQKWQPNHQAVFLVGIDSIPIFLGDFGGYIGVHHGSNRWAHLWNTTAICRSFSRGTQGISISTLEGTLSHERKTRQDSSRVLSPLQWPLRFSLEEKWVRSRRWRKFTSAKGQVTPVTFWSVCGFSTCHWWQWRRWRRHGGNAWSTISGWWFFATPLKNMTSSVGMIRHSQY